MNHGYDDKIYKPGTFRHVRNVIFNALSKEIQSFFTSNSSREVVLMLILEYISIFSDNLLRSGEKLVALCDIIMAHFQWPSVRFPASSNIKLFVSYGLSMSMQQEGLFLCNDMNEAQAIVLVTKKDNNGNPYVYYTFN